MQEVRWKEPEIVSAIGKQRARAERTQRLRKAAPRWFVWFLAFVALSRIVDLLAIPSALQMILQCLIFFVFVFFEPTESFHAVWNGDPNRAGTIRFSKLGVTRFARKWEYIAWRDIEDYRFEMCDDAPELRVLVVEARGRKTPLRLYYEGEQLEARLRDAMAQGVASTRTTISQGQQLTL